MIPLVKAIEHGRVQTFRILCTRVSLQSQAVIVVYLIEWISSLNDGL